MTEPIAVLGPLERVDGRWAVGDAGRPDGSCLEFRADGLYHRRRGAEGELIPWSRFMLGMSLTFGGRYPPRGHYALAGMFAGLPGLRGRFGGYAHATLRHPYEDWTAHFDRHVRRYRGAEVLLLEGLLQQTVRAGEAHRLGDADWLARAVAYLAPLRPWSARAFRDAVTQARESA